MARRIQGKFIVLIILLSIQSWALDKSDILVQYSFDDGNIETGPDTFIVFEKGSKGCFDLTDSFRFSGYNSVELKDGSGDKDFPELMGRFPTRKTGKLYIHFAFLTTDEDDLLNIALAGPNFFNLTKDGIGFWLKTKNGYLYHVSDSIPKKLFPINKFRWYLVDIVYDIDKGAYDLEIVEENQRSPVIVLKNQKNASNNPNSVVNIFSFVTDPFTDRSDLTYYVDDVIIGIDQEIIKAPFAAPGRKKYFVDMWDEYQFKLRQKPGCLPAIHLYDFGLDDDDIQSLEEHGLLDYLNDVANGKQFPKQQSKHISTEHLDILNGIYQWNQGCRLLANNKPAEALEMFNSSDKNLDYAPILELSRLFSLASLKRWGEVNDGLRNMHFEGLYDQRISVAQAIIGMSNANLQKAEHWLEIPAENIPQEFGDEAINETIKRIWSGEINRDLINIIERYMPEDWEEFYEQALIAEQYFYVLLWQEREKEAADFADRMIERLQFLAAPTSIWLERRGDAAFFMKEYKTAKIYYEKSLGEKKVNKVLYGKLSDINYLLGNYDEERQYREKVYGSLVDKKCS